jgi:hypothetical protein
VYRYDFETRELTWVSQPAPGCAGEGCGTQKLNAWVAALPGTEIGAEADIEDWNRAISGCPEGVSESEKAQCPKGTYDGEYIIFTTAERLQSNDVDSAVDVYEWHCSSPCPNPAAEGVVSLISDGSNAEGAGGPQAEFPLAAMSSSGADILVFSGSSLVGQDTDRLLDVYDARVNGGFPRPQEPQACSSEACLGLSAPSSFGSAASSVFAAGGNLGAAGGGTLGFQTSTPKRPTTAQLRAKALTACKKQHKRKERAACERLAKKRYPAAAKTKAKKSDRPKGKKARGAGA